MKILVIGGGGREHTLAWKFAQSSAVTEVIVAPGNGGTALEDKVSNDPAQTLPTWLALAEHSKVAFTVVGPEAPLAAGIVDHFQARGLKIFGPSQAAARLESSKIFAKDFMRRHGIPTAKYQVFHEENSARDFLHTIGVPCVIKADGLASGKGVVVAHDMMVAQKAITAMLALIPGGKILIEECLQGEELSFISLVAGDTVLPMASSRDYKRLLDGDCGPNTGGMGAYSPVPWVSTELEKKILHTVVEPALAGMRAEGHPFTGFLYAGLMIDHQGQLNVLEFNCRLGDPETQVILPRLQDDLAMILFQAVNHELAIKSLSWRQESALAVILATAAYPQATAPAALITGVQKNTDPNCLIFHAGTRFEQNLYTDGGRVLAVSALGKNLQQAHAKAYQGVQGIQFPGMQYRRDIGSLLA